MKKCQFCQAVLHFSRRLEVDKKYTGCNLKPTELLDCALKEVRAVIRSNTVLFCLQKPISRDMKIVRI